MTISIAAARRALERGADGKPLDGEAFMKLHTQEVELFDAPVNGKTPLNGENKPRTSLCQASSLNELLAAGFTEAPVGVHAKAK